MSVLRMMVGVGAALSVWATAAEAQDKKFAGRGIDPKIVAAYEKLGGKYGGWVTQRIAGSNIKRFEFGAAAAKARLPGFFFATELNTKPPIFRDTFPDPGVPFGIGFYQTLSNKNVKCLADLKSLTFLQITGDELTDAGLPELAGLTNLTILDLECRSMAGQGLKELAPLKKLSRLYLIGMARSDAMLLSLREIGRLHAFSSAFGKNTSYYPPTQDAVVELSLNHPAVSDDGLKALVPLKNLAVLDLSTSKVTDAGMKDVASHKNLISLKLGRTEVSDAGLKELAPLSKLYLLDLTSTQVSDAGMKDLARLKSLSSLTLGRTNLTAAGLKGLSGLKNLTMLNLHNTKITDDGLKDLAQLKKLTSLELTGTLMTKPGIAALRRALPKCMINPGSGERSISADACRGRVLGLRRGH